MAPRVLRQRDMRPTGNHRPVKGIRLRDLGAKRGENAASGVVSKTPKAARPDRPEPRERAALFTKAGE